MKLKREKKETIKMKRVKLKIILLMISIITIIFLLNLVISYNSGPMEFVTNRTFENSTDLFFYYGITKYPTNVEITEPEPQESNLLIGISVDLWDLSFGIIPSGGNFGKRSLILTNTQNRDAKVNLKIYGNISPMVNFSKNNFILHTNETVTIDVFCRTIDTTLEGNYTGEIDIIVKYPKYEFLYNFLNWI